MSHLTEIEEKLSGEEKVHEELILPCDCMDGDYLRITWDTDPDWRFLWIESNRWPRTLRSRAKVIWRALLGRPIEVDDVILTGASLRNLKEFIDSRVNEEL